MTRRQRKQARADRLRQWADKRQRNAERSLSSDSELRHDWAFITQPGRIPARERMNRSDERAFASLGKAKAMNERAAGIEDQLERSIYSDDPDAIDRVTERIADLEAKRARIKAYNASCRKGRPDSAVLSESEREDIQRLRQLGMAEPNDAFPAYVLQNLSGNIKRNRDRLAELGRRQQQTTQAADAGGVLIQGEEYVNVVFAEKPARDILNALKAAGFRWGGGGWYGQRDRLPQAVVAMQQGDR